MTRSSRQSRTGARSAGERTPRPYPRRAPSHRTRRRRPSPRGRTWRRAGSCTTDRFFDRATDAAAEEEEAGEGGRFRVQIRGRSRRGRRGRRRRRRRDPQGETFAGGARKPAVRYDPGAGAGVGFLAGFRSHRRRAPALTNESGGRTPSGSANSRRRRRRRRRHPPRSCAFTTASRRPSFPWATPRFSRRRRRCSATGVPRRPRARRCRWRRWGLSAAAAAMVRRRIDGRRGWRPWRPTRSDGAGMGTGAISGSRIVSISPAPISRLAAGVWARPPAFPCFATGTSRCRRPLPRFRFRPGTGASSPSRTSRAAAA